MLAPTRRDLRVHAGAQRPDAVGAVGVGVVHHLEVHVAPRHAAALHRPHPREAQRLLQVRVAAQDAPLALVILVLQP